MGPIPAELDAGGPPQKIRPPGGRLRTVSRFFSFRTRRFSDLAGPGRRRSGRCAGVRGVKRVHYQCFWVLRGVAPVWGRPLSFDPARPVQPKRLLAVDRARVSSQDVERFGPLLTSVMVNLHAPDVMPVWFERKSTSEVHDKLTGRTQRIRGNVCPLNYYGLQCIGSPDTEELRPHRTWKGDQAAVIMFQGKFKGR